MAERPGFPLGKEEIGGSRALIHEIYKRPNLRRAFRLLTEVWISNSRDFSSISCLGIIAVSVAFLNSHAKAADALRRRPLVEVGASDRRRHTSIRAPKDSAILNPEVA